jgi:GNAT superfamily N-acetyltransferase
MAQIKSVLSVRFTEGGGGCLSEVTLTGPIEGPLQLTDLFSHPNRRGKGGAGRVVAEALRFAEQRGYDLWLRIRPHGRSGLRRDALATFYMRRGFEPSATAPHLWERKCVKPT